MFPANLHFHCHTSWSFFCPMRWEIVVHFVDTGNIIDRHYLNIFQKQINKNKGAFSERLLFKEVHFQKYATFTWHWRQTTALTSQHSVSTMVYGPAFCIITWQPTVERVLHVLHRAPSGAVLWVALWEPELSNDLWTYYKDRNS